jgi:hypothetical protein
MKNIILYLLILKYNYNMELIQDLDQHKTQLSDSPPQEKKIHKILHINKIPVETELLVIVNHKNNSLTADIFKDMANPNTTISLESPKKKTREDQFQERHF